MLRIKADLFHFTMPRHTGSAELTLLLMSIVSCILAALQQLYGINRITVLLNIMTFVISCIWLSVYQWYFDYYN